MSFAFEFDDSEVDDEYVGVVSSSRSSPTGSTAAATATGNDAVPQAPFREWPLSDLLDSLPSRVSYSPIRIPLDEHDGRTRQAVLMRRDLFDARFQMLLDDEDEQNSQDQQTQPATATQLEEEEKKAVAGVASDLVPGVYEGGLKTWECSLDLVATLDQRAHGNAGEDAWSWLQGKSILELGCGTAVPSLFLFQQLLNRAQSDQPLQPAAKAAFHLCDYNSQVLRLVTLPNLILAWYFSEASQAYRTSETTINARQQEAQQLKSRGQDHFDPTGSSADAAALPSIASPGELSLDDALIEAFQASLRAHNISLRFFSGSWQGLQPADILLPSAVPSSPPSSTPAPSLPPFRDTSSASVASQGYFDLILSAETIYSLDTLPLFTDVLRRACKPSPPPGVHDLDARLARSSLADSINPVGSVEEGMEPPSSSSSEPQTLCLIGAKVLYFGVGGGVETFKQHMHSSTGNSRKGWTETVRTISHGVGRVVLSVGILPDQ